MGSPLLTPEEAARRLHISERTLRDLKRVGALRYVAISARRIAYRADDLDEYVDSRVRQEEPLGNPAAPRPRRRSKPGTIVPFTQRFGNP